MARLARFTRTVAGCAALTGGLLGSAAAMAESRVSIAVTETIAGYNPYGDSIALANSIWCQVYGCMVRYDPEKGEYTSDVFSSWTTEDPLTWVFTLKPWLERTNGDPVVPADFVHSIERIRTDPTSKQAYRVSQIVSAETRGDDKVVITTKMPLATLPDYLTMVAVTSKALWDAHGADADRDYPFGSGPYTLKKVAIDNYVILEKNPASPLVSADNPDELIYRVIREPEQRVTALLNDEVQIAQFVPPQLAERLESSPGVRVQWVDSVEMMFLAMQPSTPPWDKQEVRQAAAYAIDRDAIIQYVLQGRATRLDLPVGPGQVGYVEAPPRYPFDPDKARELLKQAGYPDGVAVELYSPSGRYTSDRQVTEAIAQMLNDVGFKVELKTPEWGTLWADVQKGGTPFYYMGRGTMTDPSVGLQQYFETGGSPRIGFSDPEVDAALQAERGTFDPAERKALLDRAMTLIVEKAPADFLWRHQMAWGVSDKITSFSPTPTGDAYGWQTHIGGQGN